MSPEANVRGDPESWDDVDHALLESLGGHPRDLVSFVASQLGLSRQAVHKHIQALIDAGWVEAFGATRSRFYRWRPLVRAKVSSSLSEDSIWRDLLAPRLRDLATNVSSLLRYGTTEMINNVIDHSGARELVVALKPLREEVEILLEDDGVGILEKLVRDLGLAGPQHAVLELAKGKLTTDPSRHTGEGIFFTCRMCDQFLIWSGNHCLMRIEGAGFAVVEPPEKRPGTTVRMVVRRDTNRTTKEVFDRFSSGSEDYGFTLTSVSVNLAREGQEGLVSRSQAKRLMARAGSFKEVHLDFRGIDSIGPSFADEIFRVFRLQHPEVGLHWENATEEVAKMIRKAERAHAQTIEEGEKPPTGQSG